jgi:hypothetical protein
MAIITAPFAVHGEHQGIKYTVEETTWTGQSGKQYSRLRLYLWCNLAQEYIFERSIQDISMVSLSIEQLARHGIA